MPDLPHLNAPSLRAERRRRVVAAAPPLGVRHLLIWLTCCAAYLAALRALAAHPPGALGVLTAAALALGYGAAWAGLTFFVARRLSATVYLIAPGEWLVAILGVRLAVETALEFAPAWIIASPKGFLAAATGVLLVLPLLSRSLPPLWKAVIAAMLFLYAAPAMMIRLETLFDFPDDSFTHVAGLFDRVRSPAALLVLTLALSLDLRRKRPYGWLHYTGIAAWLWLLAMAVVIRR
jgi:hypothetical protein